MANITTNIIFLIFLLLFFFLHHAHTTLSLPLLPITSTNQTKVYIVHVLHPDGPTELLTHDDRERWYLSFLPNATLDSGEPRMVHTYSVAMSGFAARLTTDEVRRMESIPGFLFAHVDKPVHLRTTHTPTLLGLNQYNSLWQKSSQGEGIIIGVLDSGITPDHASFADPGLPPPPLKWRGSCDLPAGFSCTNKLIGAQSFDEGGHGTHVAAIAAGTKVQDAEILGQARGTASGMAPRAHIAVYNVCSKSSCSHANNIKGFEQAIIDGVDLIQISVGVKNYAYNLNGIVIGSFAALKQGILTINSAGNSGPAKSILDNDVPWILHVGAANIDRHVDPYSIPAIHVSYTDAIKILNDYETDPNITGTITFKGTNYGARPSPTVANLSSRGPSLLNGGILKPDVIAPGVNILSAWPFKAGTHEISDNTKNFIMERGTSMAAPHVSGVAALLKKLHPDWSPAAIKSAIMTTAYSLDRDGDPIKDDGERDRASIFAIGAGHINPEAANDPGLVYDFINADDYIPYLCSLKGYKSAMVTRIVNQDVTCGRKKMGAEEVNYPSIQVSMGFAGAKEKTVQRTVKNVGEASAKYTASVVKPSGVEVVVSPETLEFSNVGEEQKFTVVLSLTGKGKLNKDDVLEGRLKWVSESGKQEVSSPIVVTA
ncbi:Subtilisin-like protease SDD1 [Dendrobium catenatum]|uniref:Subtilisin-like protease SDD1 n=1 Tax=Dendrobium catenatum TaxID=906689 RepID=A0A2I0WS86_9ASPA|nr:Subtilisin-like protease SDD1 [Dendrobium catenatum]